MFKTYSFLFCLVVLAVSCREETKTAVAPDLNELNLKRGNIVVCGPGDKEFGAVSFESSVPDALKKDFDLGIAMLHSFEYDEAEKSFAKVIDGNPDIPMAYWGVAMANFHPLWAPPTQEELKKGSKAVEIAKSKKEKSKRESDYINAIAAFYKDYDSVAHKARCLRFESAMEKLHTSYPDDKEAAIFYALSLTAAADPADKTFSKQKKAGAILNSLYPGQPNHPGIVHYIIHTFDSPELATMALEAARKYASVAPSSSHALHMPSHIFTRLGLWDESISSNLAAVSSAKCYAEANNIKEHWDEEIHGMDYLVYAYLQKGDNDNAKQQWDYMRTFENVHPSNFKVAYAFASIPSRYLMENKMWKEAANLQPHAANFDWKDHQWQKAIIHFTRLLGSVNTGNVNAANTELAELNRIQQMLAGQKDTYKANQVAIQAKAGEAWIKFRQNKNDEALSLMTMVADMENKTEKHPVTPGEVVAARQLLADMLLEMNEPAKALTEYEADLKKHPNRFNSLYGAAVAAERTGNKAKAKSYYQNLVEIAGASLRPEVVAAKLKV
jgi:hypothetical protein